MLYAVEPNEEIITHFKILRLEILKYINPITIQAYKRKYAPASAAPSPTPENTNIHVNTFLAKLARLHDEIQSFIMPTMVNKNISDKKSSSLIHECLEILQQHEQLRVKLISLAQPSPSTTLPEQQSPRKHPTGSDASPENLRRHRTNSLSARQLPITTLTKMASSSSLNVANQGLL